MATSICPTPPTTCALEPHLVHQACTCNFVWTNGCIDPVGTRLVCDGAQIQPPPQPPLQPPSPLPPPPPSPAPSPCTNYSSWTLHGLVVGLILTEPVIVSIGTVDGDSQLAVHTVSDSSSTAFAFTGLARAAHFLKAEGVGYDLSVALVIAPPDCGYSPAPEAPPLATTNVTLNVSAGEGLRGAEADGVFRYRWVEDASRAGAAETSHAVNAPNITFLNETFPLGDDQATSRLQHELNILLVDTEIPWSSEYAFRLLETLYAVPQRQTRSFYAPQTLPPSKWILTGDHLPNDVSIARNGSAFVVRVASAAFVHASPQVVRLDGVRGRFFSRRLHHAVVRFVTREGADTLAVQHIMQARYGCSTGMSAPLYSQLTAPTTREDAAAFQPFETWREEPLLLLNMFEELPEGLHQTPGLRTCYAASMAKFTRSIRPRPPLRGRRRTTAATSSSWRVLFSLATCDTRAGSFCTKRRTLCGETCSPPHFVRIGSPSPAGFPTRMRPAAGAPRSN